VARGCALPDPGKILLIAALAVADRDRPSGAATAKPEAAMGCRRVLSVGNGLLLSEESSKDNPLDSLRIEYGAVGSNYKRPR
jgi:hypothetical protein